MTRRRLEPGEAGEIYYEKRGSGWLAAQYIRDNSGRRRKLRGGGSTKVEARRQLKENLEKAFRAGGGGYKSTSRFEEAVDEWLRSVALQVERGSRSPTTYDQYERNARVHVKPGVGHLQLAELTTGRLDEFLRDVHDRVGYSTAKISRTVLSGTCSMLTRRDALRVNPVRDVGRLEQGSKAAPRALSVAEIRALFELLDGNDYARRKDLPDLLRFLFATGVRIGEALAVRWADVDLAAGVVVVDHTIVRVKGKGLVRKGTKSDASDRDLALPGWAVGMLARRYVGQDLEKPVFADTIGGWRDKSNVGRDIRKVRAGSALSWVKSHSARRTVATLLDGQGLSARAIADQLGHARPSMTQDVYMGRRVVGGGQAQHLDQLLGDLGKPRAVEPEDDDNEGQGDEGKAS